MNDHGILELKGHQEDKSVWNEYSWRDDHGSPSGWPQYYYYFLKISPNLLGFVMTSLFKMIAPGNTLARPLSLVIFMPVFFKASFVSIFIFSTSYIFLSRKIYLNCIPLNFQFVQFSFQELSLQFDSSAFEILNLSNETVLQDNRKKPNLKKKKKTD